MNVKALMCAVGGFIVCAIVATMWMQHDMSSISAADQAKLKKQCQTMALAAKASGISSSSQTQVEKCKTVGVVLDRVAQISGAPAPAGALAANSQTPGSNLAPLEAYELAHPDAVGGTSQDPSAKGGNPANGGTHASLAQVVAANAQAPVEQTTGPTGSARVNTAGLPDHVTGPVYGGPSPNDIAPDSPQDGSVTAIPPG